MQSTPNLVHLHGQITSCEEILSKMAGLLNGFQEDLGEISTEIDTLQAASFSMNISLKNRKVS
jgi:hypothetical protein